VATEGAKLIEAFETEIKQRQCDWEMERAVWPEMETYIMAKAPISKEAAFHEVFHNKPKTVDTSKSAAGQRKQMIAIALSKAGLSKPGKNAK
jgi:hypothetical protein